jgi:catechol 2,3-dioxygenase-like lactoylglutathione lyase family enzyme
MRITHVSIHANDLEESARFYEEVFGMERIPTAKFPDPVQWLRLGESQLHLFIADGTEPPPRHHLGIDVDDFEGVYLKAIERGILELMLGAPREHPTGWVQMYIRDPAGNLVEVDCADASTIDRSIVPLERLVDEVPQSGEAAYATLYNERLVVPS